MSVFLYISLQKGEIKALVCRTSWDITNNTLFGGSLNLLRNEKLQRQNINAILMSCSFCLTEHQEKISSCKEKIEKAKAETITDEELNALQNKMEEKLQEEKQLRQELR